MKTSVSFFQSFLITILISAAISVTHAATWSVDNSPGGSADFENLQTAINSVAAGDTLILAGSSTTYGNVTLNKEIHLVGPGWYHAENFPDASPLDGAIIDKVTLPNAASNGSSLKSLQIGTIDADDCGDLLIERIAPTFEAGQTYLQLKNVNGATIRQCYKVNVQGGTLSNNTSNLKIYNNYIVSTIHTTAFASDIYNNVFNGYLIAVDHATFRYNIVYSNSVSMTLNNCLAEYNIIDATDPDYRNPWPGDTNLNEVPQGNIFTGGALGARWQLKTDSPAINIDGLGTNAGIYGGDHPYILSGMPAVPVVYHVNAPVTAQAGETINISFKATAEPVIEDDTTDEPTDDIPLDL